MYLRNGFRWSVPITALLVASSFFFPQTATTRSVLPHLAIGTGWSCDVFVTNQHSAIAQGLTLSLFDDQGQPLQAETDSHQGSTFPFNLAPGETRIFRFTRSSGLKTGYAILEVPYDLPSIRATLFIRWVSGGKTATQLGVPHQNPFNHFSFPVEVNPAKGINTGIAVVRLPRASGASTGNAVVSLIAADGTLEATSLLPLAQGEHLARLLNEQELFPQLTQFSGTVSISSVDPLGVLALRLEGTALGSESISSGPVTGAFRIQSAPVPEAEPNNQQSQAQLLSLPALVSGSIGTPGEFDFFAFQGRAGDILTAFTETSAQTSRADTVLTLYAPAGSSIAQNDQNGLFACNDSFLQVLLPADGLYALKLHDYFQGGGPDFDYLLHLSLNSDNGVPEPPKTPQIQAVMPASMNQGQSGTVTLSGTNLGGVTQVLFSPPTGIAVSNVQATPGTVTAQVQVSGSAAAGARQVSVSGPAGTSNSLPFTINSVAGQVPVLTHMTPTSAKIGSYQGLFLTGSNLGQVTSINVVPSTGVVISSLDVSSSTSVSATLQIQSSAPTGQRQVSVTSPAGTSNSLTLTILPENPPPQITDIRPDSGRATRTLDITISGNYLSQVQSINFSPAQGITVSELDAHTWWVDAKIAIAANAAPGVRQVTVTTPYGTSNAVEFNVLPAPVGSAPTISNLTVGGVLYSGGKAYISLSFDFADPDGDLIWNPDDWDQSVAFILKGPSCSHTHSSSEYHWPGRTSGRIELTIVLESYVRGDIAASIQLRDAEGNLSNVLEFRIEAWLCG